MGLDEELESMEEPGETDAEWIDQETELQDVEGDEDEIFGADAAESDVEHAYDSFMTDNEADYDGWDEGDVDEARAAEEEYYDNAADIVADSYESAYARRMRGFRSAEYRMPSSYYALRYENSGAFMFASAYDPAFYNIMVSGDQVWVEPKYITSMFGSWGATPYYGGWYFGWNYPSFGWGYPSFGWGYPHHPWWGWNWSIGYWPWHDHWWGHPVPPHYHPGGGSHPRPNRPDIVHRPGFTSPATNRNFGTQAPAGRGSNSSFGVRNPQGGGSVRPGQSTGRPSGNGISRGGSMNRSNRGGTTTFDRGSSNSTFNRGGSPAYNPGSAPSYNRGGGSFTPPSGRNAGGR